LSDMELADLVTVEEALRIFSEEVPQRTPGSTHIPVTDALGRVLAAEVIAAVDVPGFSRSTVDGYAVRSRDTFGASAGAPAYLELVGEIAMGEAADYTLKPGQAVAVSTGGMLPDGADAALMVEYTDETPDGHVEVRRPVAPYENVVEKGDDIRRGKRLLHAGHRLRPQDMGALAGIGLTEVCVFERPRVAIISTGDEIVPPEFEPGPGEIRDINSYSLAGQIEQDGALALPMGIVPDVYDILRETVEKALAQASAVLISGGSSVGARDVAAAVINSLGEPGVVVHGVTLRPGKPTILAVVGGKPVYGMPGHPVSAMVVYRVFVRPVLRHLMGCRVEAPVLGYVEAVLTRNIHSDPGRLEYARVQLQSTPDGMKTAPVLGASGLITTMTRADGYVVVPLGSDGIQAGTLVRVFPFEGS